MSICTNLESFAGGALAPADADAFRDHLADCRECQQQLHELMQMESLAQLYHREDGSVVRRAARPQPLFPRVRLLTPAAAAVAVIAAVVSVVANQRVGSRYSLSPPGAYHVSISGQVELERGSARTSTSTMSLPIYLPASRVQLLIEPLDPSRAGDESVQLFVADPDDRLSPVPDRAISAGEEGSRIFSAIARELFGDREGVWTIYVVIADHPEDLVELGPHLRLKSIPIEYRLRAPR